MLQVKKRNGILVPFDKQRIINAINKAFVSVDGVLYEDETSKDIADEISYKIKHSDFIVSVEQIQDWVEDFLMQSERRDVAKAYVRYRYKREVARKGGDEFLKAYSQKINAQDIENQNANIDELSFGGRVGAGSDLMMKRYALDYCVSSMARRNHENNEIYIHDLSAYPIGMHNCLSIPFDDLLAKGFNTRQTDVRPAGSVNTAFQLVAVIFQLQSLQQFGGVSATHLDWTMVPYVRKSFAKHWRTAMNTEIAYVYGKQPGAKKYDDLSPELQAEIDAINAVNVKIIEAQNDNSIINVSITDKEYYPRDKYGFACDMAWQELDREVHQAVEGMYHNLK